MRVLFDELLDVDSEPGFLEDDPGTDPDADNWTSFSSS